MKKICTECNLKFSTNICKQTVCSKCRKLLICKEYGCNNKVSCVEKRLCKKHHARYRRSLIKKPEGICKNCGKIFLNNTKFRKDYCDDCEDLRHNLVCTVEGCNNKGLSFNIRVCLSHHMNRKKPVVEKYCKLCGKLFFTNIRKFCSKECKDKYDIERGIKKSREKSLKKRLSIGYNKCKICGKDFLPKLFYGKRQKCCSDKCRDIHSRQFKKEWYRSKIKSQHLNRGQSFPQMFIYKLLKKYFDNLDWEYNNRRILKNSDTGKCLEIDIWCPEKRVAIEFDGDHHFKPKFGEKMFKYTKKMDALKNILCKKLHIKLLRIAHTDPWKDNDWIINKVGEMINNANN